MFPFGRLYEVEFPTFTRSLTADEVICRVSAPATAVVLVLEMWFGIVATDDLNEPNSMEIVRLSSDGTGGVAAVFTPKEIGSTAFGGSGATIDAGDWTAEPTISGTPLGGGKPFNLSVGWEWDWTRSGPIVVSPSGRIGFRIVDPISASMVCHAGMTILEIGT